ncbi:sigma-54-dependent transcriptional regulator [Fuerstiella marisgermanici]|uniref:Transcriptional regulatory protein ZraR n=1 Tax=Fuerstiella marisgermanici TaxID=1891926 RepID=A0A1P8W9U4_9PLAN|nr:sigma-54 dependent transcriptional regulator [Fuerstiella marisgermanici]APZ90827.1 Transcriptional regulatory protein ZraR [Fuerstiella marisgermanici]
MPDPSFFNKSILIVEDEDIIRETLSEFLAGEGFEVATAANVTDALNLVRERDFDVGICDVQLPDGDGVQLLRRLHRLNPAMFVLIISAYATVENAVEAFTAGAFDYLVKPVIFDELVNRLKRLFKFQDLYVENQRLRKDLDRRAGFDQIIGSSRVLQDTLNTIRKVAATNSNVLLVGETGTGKELFAREIHMAGPNKDEKFLAVNCGTRPVELLESQLFGVDDGQPGLFRTAGEGTVFLDEIAQLPPGTQSELLRAIEYQEIMPAGASETVKVTARIIAATSRDLMREVADTNFQEDLFYRLDGVKIRIPPLRERLDDIPELVEYFMTRHSEAMGKRVTGATSETIRTLMAAHWKGNVRQLDNAIERAVMMCEGDEIQPSDLPPDLLGIGTALPDTDDLRSALRHYERLHITRVLKQCPDKKEAAKRLKLGLSSLYRKIEELKIEL